MFSHCQWDTQGAYALAQAQDFLTCLTLLLGASKTAIRQTFYMAFIALVTYIDRTGRLKKWEEETVSVIPCAEHSTPHPACPSVGRCEMVWVQTVEFPLLTSPNV